jgi:hypothetical protein
LPVAQEPYVFISYSQESDEHVHRVLTLAQWLRHNGVDAYVDKFEQSPPEGWQLWCYQQVMKASYVLVVCTETYERRVLREESEGVGRGATWEGAIITNQIYDATHGQSKFIPVVFASDDIAHVPFFLDSSTVYEVSDERSLRALYRRITDQPEYVPAPLGEVIDFPQADLETARPVVPFPPPSAAGVPAPTPAPTPQRTARLADVIEGTWVVQIQTVYGMQVMRITLTKGFLGRRNFEAVAVVGPPGWQATGDWEILPGEQLVLRGTQMLGQPFPQPALYQTFNQFFSITQSEMHGMSSAQEAVIWRRS